ncbi:MAG: tRNA (N6-isopentenyl adenosine(37)-C2)-methylthiotransferase MiaB [Christensenellales bacterium]
MAARNEGLGLAYHIITYGCQMNAHDSERLAGMLAMMGYHATDDVDQADLVLMNTCCVRDNAERRVMGNVGFLREKKQRREGMIVAVCGCMMQQPGVADALVKKYPFVDIVFGTHNLPEFPRMLRRALIDGQPVRSVAEGDDAVVEGVPALRRQGPLTFMNIMYGCNNFCAYCIVPYVRGRERSRRLEDILAEARQVAREGFKEITLLGQNVNSYADGRTDFAALLRALDTDPGLAGVERIRFMTSHPKDLSEGVMRVMAEGARICHQLHLPVQSGSTEILKRMNRRYTRQDYLDLVDRLRGFVPDVGLTTDIIVGFPGETDADYQDTLSLVERVGFQAAFTFQYSPRRGTPAAAMPDQVPDAVAKERLNQLIALQERKTQQVYQQMVGRRETVLVEGVSARNSAMVSGKTDGGVTVNFPGGVERIGRMVPVKIVQAKQHTLLGEAIAQEGGR